MTHLPAEWTAVRLDAVAEVKLGRQRSPKNHFGERMRPYLRAANVTWVGLDLSDVKEMNFTEKESDIFELRPGDVLLAEASGSESEVGKPAIWRGEIDGCCFQNTLVRVRPSAQLVPEFVLWFLAHEARSGKFGRAARGVGIHHIGAGTLSAWPLPVPPIEEQKRIVDTIEEEFSRLDAALAGLRIARVKAARFRRSLFHAAVTGGLTGMTTDFEERHLDDVLDVVIDHRGKTPAKLGGEFVESGVRVISAIHIKNRRIRFEERERFVTHEMFERWMPVRTRPGDVILTSEAPLGSVALVEDDRPLVLSQRLFCLRGRTGVLANPFLRLFLESPDGQEQLNRRSSGTTVSGIRQSELRQVRVPVPSIEQQEKIVGTLEQQLTRLDAALGIADSIESRAAAFRHALLQAAFTGNLTRSRRDASRV